MNFTLTDSIRKSRPLVHCITNFVTVNDCANLLLACGASPTMADTPEEMDEIVALANSLVVNIGTISTASRSAMFTAAAAAKKLRRPAVLDPVGAGASKLRTETARQLLETGAFSLLRGNISEIRAVAGVNFSSHGVDASEEDMLTPENCDATIDFARSLAKKYNVTVAISGAVDLICDAARTALIRNGDPMMPLVTGSGCMLTALCGAFLAVGDDPFSAASEAFCAMGICGETAKQKLLPDEGNATYRNRMIDAMFHLNSTTMKAKARIEIL